MQHIFECEPLRWWHVRWSRSHQLVRAHVKSAIHTQNCSRHTHHRIALVNDTTTKAQKNWRHSKLSCVIIVFLLLLLLLRPMSSSFSQWLHTSKLKKTFIRDINKITEKEHTHIAHRLEPNEVKMMWSQFWVVIFLFFILNFSGKSWRILSSDMWFVIGKRETKNDVKHSRFLVWSENNPFNRYKNGVCENVVQLVKTSRCGYYFSHAPQSRTNAASACL